MLDLVMRNKPTFNIQIKDRTLQTDVYYLAKMFTKVKQGYSPIIGICGKQRIGKSVIGVWLSYMFMQMFGKEYDPTEYTFYDPIKAISNLENKDRIPLLIDEAGGILHRREYYEKIHQSLNKIIQTQGYKTIMYIFVSPFISDIDKSFTKHFDFILRVDARGHYKAFEVVKKYDQSDNNKATYTRFMDDVRLNLSDLPNDIWEIYQEFSINEKEKMRKEIELKEQAHYITKKKKEEHLTDPLKMLAKKHGVKI
jgi:hypothetical protein